MKVVINTKIGGFRPSDLAVTLYYDTKGFPKVVQEGLSSRRFYDPKNPDDWLSSWDIPRHDPDFIKIVEELGELASHEDYCQLKIVDIPDGVEYIICEHDCGTEWIAEKHRTWD